MPGIFPAWTIARPRPLNTFLYLTDKVRDQTDPIIKTSSLPFPDILYCINYLKSAPFFLIINYFDFHMSQTLVPALISLLSDVNLIATGFLLFHDSLQTICPFFLRQLLLFLVHRAHPMRDADRMSLDLPVVMHSYSNPWGALSWNSRRFHRTISRW